MGILANIFTWWNGATFGTWLFTARKGTKVGEDHQGNVYYEGGVDPNGLTRRWVMYNGANDSSRVPPEWHLWLHKTRDEAPSQTPLPVKAWEKPWRPNPTGSDKAEMPSGALAAGGRRAAAAADYRPWTPGQ